MTTATAEIDSTNMPPSAEFSAAWVAYVLHAAGAFGFFFGPLIGLIINYVKRNAEQAGFIASHHRWLIRTTWWTLAGYVVFLGLIVVGVWPIVGDIVRDVVHSGGDMRGIPTINIAWESIFATVGATLIGSVGLLCLWLWFIYRLIRGALRLGSAREVP